MTNPEEDENEEKFENEGADEGDEGDGENKIYWMEREIANYVGFKITVKTHLGDYLCGKILGVKDCGLLMSDKKDNRMYCDLQCIATYCIFNKNKTQKIVKGKKKQAQTKKANKTK